MDLKAVLKKETERKCEFPEAEEAQRRPGPEQRTNWPIPFGERQQPRGVKQAWCPASRTAAGLTSSSTTARDRAENGGGSEHSRVHTLPTAQARGSVPFPWPCSSWSLPLHHLCFHHISPEACCIYNLVSPLSMYPGVLKMWSSFQRHQNPPRILLEIQIHRPCPRPSESETLAGEAQESVF